MKGNIFNWGTNIKVQPPKSEKNEILFLLEEVYTFYGTYLCSQTECLLCKVSYKVLYETENWRKLLFKNVLKKTLCRVPMMTFIKL